MVFGLNSDCTGNLEKMCSVQEYGSKYKMGVHADVFLCGPAWLVISDLV